MDTRIRAVPLPERDPDGYNLYLHLTLMTAHEMQQLFEQVESLPLFEGVECRKVALNERQFVIKVDLSDEDLETVKGRLAEATS